jgi:hypothetical protein
VQGRSFEEERVPEILAQDGEDCSGVVTLGVIEQTVPDEGIDLAVVIFRSSGIVCALAGTPMPADPLGVGVSDRRDLSLPPNLSYA